MLFLLISFLSCKISSKHPYAVLYGHRKAKHILVNYFDIGCTHCLDFYRRTFPKIKKNFCDTNKLLFIYKPYPIHQETLAYTSCCLALRDEEKKKALFETLMEMDVPITTDIIAECMKVLKTPYPGITAKALQDALILTQKQNFDSLPVMFFDDRRLTDKEQEHVLSFLRKAVL